MKDADGNTFQIVMVSVQIHPKLNTNSDITKCYKFQILEDNANNLSSTMLGEYKAFFEKFFLYTNQTNVDNLKSQIFMQIKESLFYERNLHHKYMKFIFDWSRQEGTKTKLHRQMMQKVLTLFLLSQFIQPLSFGRVSKNGKILQSAVSKFHLTIFDRDCINNLEKIWGDVRNGIDEAELTILDHFYQISEKRNGDLKCLNNMDWSKLLWLQGKCPLIIRECSEFYKVFKLCSDRSFVLIADEIPLALKLQEDHSVFQKLNDLKFYGDIYLNLCKNFIVSLPGQDLSLQSLINQSKNFECLITTNELLKMIENPFVLTQEKEEIVVPYVNRFLVRFTILLEYLDKVDNGTLLVISNVNSEEDLLLLSKYNPFYVEEFIKNNQSETPQIKDTAFSPRRKIFLSKKLCSQEEFDFICSKNKMMLSFHHFKIIDGDLEWLKSHKRSDISKLKQHRVKKSFLHENELWMINFENHVHIVSGDPGMGKSCLLRNLKNNFSSKIWTIMFTPQEITQIADFLFSHKYKVEDVEDFILSLKYPTYTSFTKDLLKLLKRNGQIVFFWDALDEIVFDDDLDEITKLIKRFSKDNISQWITCRLHLEEKLERIFNVCSIEIMQFTKEQQIYYIKERLKDLPSQLETLADITIKIINNIESFHCQNILGIPLQIYMLTELCLRDVLKYSALLERQLLLTDLYKYFVDEKFIFFYKDKIKVHDSQAYALKQTQKNHLRIFEVAALRMLLNDETFKQLRVDSDYLEDLKTEADCFGFVSNVSESVGTIDISFSHVSYAEYLVAVYFSKHKEELNLKGIIFREKYTNIRFFFDMLLAQHSPAHVAVLYKNISLLRSYKEEVFCKDSGGRNVLQVAASWGVQYPVLSYRISEGDYILENEPFSVDSESTEYLDTIDYLLDKCNVNELDSLFSMNAINYAEITQCVFVLVVIENKHKLGYFEHKNYDFNCSVLYYIVNLNLEIFLPLFKKYLKRVKTKQRDTLLHMASRKGYDKIVASLIEFGVDTNASNSIGWRPLHVASFTGHNTIVELLIKSGSKVTVSDLLDHATPVHEASKQGHKQTIEILLKHGANIASLNDIEQSPLHLASENGHTETVKFLVSRGATVDAMDKNGETPLIAACYKGYYEIVKFLIQSGSSVNLMEKITWTPLYTACRYGHDQIVDLLIKLEEQHVNVSDKDHWTPLYAASRNGYTTIVKHLIQYDANVNACTISKETPVFADAQHGHDDVVWVLIENGADVNKADKVGRTPLYVACKNGHYRTTQILLEHGSTINDSKNNWIPLIAASANGHEKTVELLLQYGANADALDTLNRTPLVAACVNGHKKVVDMIVKSGIDVNKYGAKSLYMAAQAGHLRVVETLSRQGVEISSRDGDDNTMLHIASEKGHENVVEILINQGVEVNSLNKLGMSPLHLAAREGKTETVKLLINYGATIDERDANGTTPLIHSCIWGHCNITKLLILSKADVNVFDCNGLSPLGAALHNNHQKVVDLLHSYGANNTIVETIISTPLYFFCESNDLRSVVCCIMIMNAKVETMVYNGWRAIHIACFKGHKEIVTKLLHSGANVNALTAAGNTPIELAQENGHLNIVQQIKQFSKKYDQLGC